MLLFALMFDSYRYFVLKNSSGFKKGCRCSEMFHYSLGFGIRFRALSGKTGWLFDRDGELDGFGNGSCHSSERICLKWIEL